MTQSFVEKRKHKRYDLHVKLYLKSVNCSFNDFWAETINLSESGAFIKTPEDIELFERFQGILEIPEDIKYPETFNKINFEGIFIRKEIRLAQQIKEYYAGIYFEHIEKEKITEIKKFINKFGEKNLFYKILNFFIKPV